MLIDRCEQRSYEWHLLRQGKVTGTSLKSAMGTPEVQDTLMYKLISERMTEPKIDDLNSEAVQHGKDYEHMAIQAISSATNKTFEEVGMLIDSRLDDYGVSPDGCYFENDVLVGGVEVKCPNSKKHVEYLINDEIPKEYIYQVKAPFLLCPTLKFWIFGSFDDRNYECPLFYKIFNREDYTDLTKDKLKLELFLERVNQQHMDLTF